MKFVEKQMTTYIDAVVSAVRKEFDDYPVSDSYPESKKLKADSLPKIFINVTGLDPVDFSPGTEELEASVTWELRAVFHTADTQRARVSAAGLAARAAVFINEKTWNLPYCREAKVLAAEDDNFDRWVPTVEVWSVSFSQTIRLGENSWESSQDLYADGRLN